MKVAEVMSTRNKNHSRSGRIQPEAIRQTKASLQDLPEKKKGLLSLQEAICQLHDPLKTALDKGYTYQELAVMLQNQGIAITESTLKNYYFASAKQSARCEGSSKARNGSAKSTSEQVSHPVETSIPSRVNVSSYNVCQDFLGAYQASLQEREEVYRRLAES